MFVEATKTDLTRLTKPFLVCLDKMPRCSAADCKRKVILDIACRCAGKFCPIHRLPEDHACTFDYKTEGKKQLSENLVKVTAEKVLII